MNVITADQENPDGSLNMSIENLSAEEANVLIAKGLLQILKEEAERVLDAQNLSEKYMTTCIQMVIHPVGTSPMDMKDSIVLSVVPAPENTLRIHITNLTSGKQQEFSAEILGMIQQGSDRLLKQKGVQDVLQGKVKQKARGL